MTADALKSLSITNLDASPIVPNTAAIGAAYAKKAVRDFVTPTTGGLASTSSKYKMVRVPSNCYLKDVKVVADAALDSNVSPTLAIDVGAYYSDSTVDGTKVANQGAVISATAFASNVAFGDAAHLTITPTVGLWTETKRQTLLWSALGLSADPGGQIDIVVAVHVVAATAVASPFGVEAEFAMP